MLGDATGHGIAPALSVTQMQAMLRMAFRLGADLETAFLQVNNRLAETLADDRFITAFIGLLDPATHVLRFHSGGQGPILRYRAADAHLRALQADELSAGRDAAVVAAAGDRSSTMHPGDILVLVSDGIYEQENAARRAVRRSARARRSSRPTATKPMAELLALLLDVGAVRSPEARRRRTT